jgi:hypothetical protein
MAVGINRVGLDAWHSRRPRRACAAVTFLPASLPQGSP